MFSAVVFWLLPFHFDTGFDTIDKNGFIAVIAADAEDRAVRVDYIVRNPNAPGNVARNHTIDRTKETDRIRPLPVSTQTSL